MSLFRDDIVAPSMMPIGSVSTYDERMSARAEADTNPPENFISRDSLDTRIFRERKKEARRALFSSGVSSAAAGMSDSSLLTASQNSSGGGAAETSDALIYCHPEYTEKGSTIVNCVRKSASLVKEEDNLFDGRPKLDECTAGCSRQGFPRPGEVVTAFTPVVLFVNDDSCGCSSIGGPMGSKCWLAGDQDRPAARCASQVSREGGGLPLVVRFVSKSLVPAGANAFRSVPSAASALLSGDVVQLSTITRGTLVAKSSGSLGFTADAYEAGTRPYWRVTAQAGRQAGSHVRISDTVTLELCSEDGTSTTGKYLAALNGDLSSTPFAWRLSGLPEFKGAVNALRAAGVKVDRSAAKKTSAVVRFKKAAAWKKVFAIASACALALAVVALVYVSTKSYKKRKQAKKDAEQLELLSSQQMSPAGRADGDEDMFL